MLGITPETVNILQAFTCRMYAPSSHTIKVNALRYELFVSKRGEVESSALPPCEVYSSTFNVPVIKPVYGRKPWRDTLTFLTQLVMDGPNWKVHQSLGLTGCIRSLLQILCWNFSRASARKSAKLVNVFAWTVVSNVPICACYRHVETKKMIPKTRMIMTLTCRTWMTMMIIMIKDSIILCSSLSSPCCYSE